MAYLKMCKVYLKKKVPNIDLSHIEILQPFQYNSNLCYFKAKNVLGTTKKACATCASVHGILYDWSMDVTILPNFPSMDIITEQYLPDEPTSRKNFIRSQSLPRIIPQQYHMGDKEEDYYKYNLAGYKKFGLRYYGVHMRLFKYSGRVYLLEESGMDGKYLQVDMETTAWDLLGLKAGHSPDKASGNSYANMTMGTIMQAQHTSRSIEGEYVVLNNYADTCLTNSANILTKTLGSMNIQYIEDKHPYQPLGSHKHIIRAPTLTRCCVKEIFETGYGDQNGDIIQCRGIFLLSK